jgi:Tol biopolymer transport system component
MNTHGGETSVDHRTEGYSMRRDAYLTIRLCILVLLLFIFAGSESAGPDERRMLVWADRQGRLTPVIETVKDYHCSLALSPDGQYLVVEVGPRKDGDLWRVDLERKTLMQLTHDEAGAYDPLFSPDGKFVYFSSKRGERWGLFRKRTDGSGDEERVTDSDHLQIASSISSDGRYLAYFQREGDEDWDIWALSLDGTSPPHELFESSFAAVTPVFSPDGHRVVYPSNESGDWEIFVQTFPGPGDTARVSPAGSEIPWGRPSKTLWSRDGLRLFSVSSDETVWEVTVEQTLKPSPPKKLFRLPEGSLLKATRGCWEISGDGGRFYFIRQLENETTGP